MLNNYAREAFTHWHIVALTTIACLVLVAVIYSIAGKPAGEVPVIGGDVVTKTVPAFGEAGYMAGDTFCSDPSTKVTPLIIPDSSGYQLTRTKDGKFESITVIININSGEPAYAKYDDGGSTGPIPAILTADFRQCLHDKVGIK